MKSKYIYLFLGLAVAAAIGFYIYNKYNVAPKIDISNIEVVDQDTVLFDISSLKGKKVIVSFYASWCPNCIDELREINSIKQQKLNDVTVLAITDEGLEKLTEFKNKTNYPYTFLALTRGFNSFGIFSIPTTYLLNTKGEVVYDKVGYIDWKDESTLEHLKSLMQ